MSYGHIIHRSGEKVERSLNRRAAPVGSPSRTCGVCGLWNGRVVDRAVVDRRHSFPLAMGDADRDHAGAGIALAIVGLEGNLIDTAVAVPRSFGANRCGTRLNYRIGARVAVALGVDRLILGHAGDGNGHGITVWIGYAIHGYRDKLMIGRPERGGIRLRGAADRRLVRGRVTDLRHKGVVVAASKRALDGTARGARKAALRGPDHVRAAGLVHGDPVAGVRAAAAAAQIGRIDEGGPGRVELGDEDVGWAVCKSRARDDAKHVLANRVLNETARGAGKVRRGGPPGHIGVAGCVHGDPLAAVIADAAQIGRIDEGGPGRVELGDEGVVEDAGAAIRALDETARGAGKV